MLAGLKETSLPGRRAAAAVTKGTAYEAAGAGDGAESLPDPDLANKVRTEIFRAADAPKGDVNVNVENGVVYLRGELPDRELMDKLVARARKVEGVQGVENLTHLAGSQSS